MAAVFLAPQFRTHYLRLLDKSLEEASRAYPFQPGGTVTFSWEGAVRMSAQNHAVWLRHESAVVFIRAILSGKSGDAAREDAEAFCREANAKHNARNTKMMTNQVWDDHGVAATWGLYNTLRDCHAAQVIREAA